MFPKLRWLIGGLLFAETVLNYLDLQTLSVLAPKLKQELGMTASQYGGIQDAFLYSYLFSFLVGGWILDRLGIRWGMALSITWWSLAEIYHGFAQSPHDLMIGRIFFGLAYPGAYITAAKVVAEWFPPEERGIGTGLYTAGATIGGMIAPPLVTWVALQFNWRYTFFITGAMGLFYVVVWLILYRPLEEHHWLSDAEKSHILRGRNELQMLRNGGPLSMTDVLRDRHFWAVALGRFFSDGAWWFYVAWIPTYLNNVHELEFAEIGRIAWIPFLFADFGSLGGGWASGRLVKRGWPVLRARLAIMLFCAFISVFAFTLGSISSQSLLIAVLSLLTFSIMAWMVNIGTIPTDAFPAAIVGRVTGLTSTAAILGTMVINKFATQSAVTGDYSIVFIVMSVSTPVAFVIVYLFMRRSPLFSRSEG